VRRSLPSLIILIAISSGSLFFHLGSLPLTGADEPRYARIAQEMHERGAWITPELEGKPWLEKPPLYYWITSPLYFVFSSPETASRVGPALCALLAAIAIFWVGSVMWTRLAGMLSASMLLTSLGFAGFGRSATTDMPFTCFLTISMAILAVAIEKNLGRKVLWAYLFLGLAVLGKGPVALILAIGIGLCFWLFNEREGTLHRWHLLPGILITAAVSIPWFWLAFHQNGYAFIATFFINHNLARYITSIHHHSQPFYFYLPVLLALFFPWSGWLIMLAGRSPLKELRRWRQWHSGMLFTVCWFLFPIIFFSLSGSKLAGYILPSLPPLAIIVGVHISHWIEGGADLPRLRAGIWLQGAISLLMAIAAPIYFQKDYGGNWKVGLLISVGVLIPAVFAFIYGQKGSCLRAFKATAIQGLAMLLVVVIFAFPVLGAYHSTRTISLEALALRRAEEPILTYKFFHHTLHYYTGYQIAPELADLESLRQFLQKQPSALAVTKIDGMKEIQACQDISATLLAKQGKFMLIRVSAISLQLSAFRRGASRLVFEIP
jgi:4-amino-4-deoxy-L-arabinose transferase-like glycosyltransferase